MASVVRQKIISGREPNVTPRHSLETLPERYSDFRRGLNNLLSGRDCRYLRSLLHGTVETCSEHPRELIADAYGIEGTCATRCRYHQ